MPKNLISEDKFKCPECGSQQYKVTDSRWGKPRINENIHHIRRRRECENGHKFWTIEIKADVFNTLVKSFRSTRQFVRSMWDLGPEPSDD